MPNASATKRRGEPALLVAIAPAIDGHGLGAAYDHLAVVYDELEEAQQISEVIRITRDYLATLTLEELSSRCFPAMTNGPTSSA